VLPKEGATGWSDTWMISMKSAHPHCAYKWMNWAISPKTNAQIAEYFGEAPANRMSCQQTADPNFCATYHADDENYYRQIWLWTTPIPQCLDGRKNVKCTSYQQWTQKWTEIKG
jgi:putative spermidine/putrescine transport system substrate-binding protein